MRIAASSFAIVGVLLLAILFGAVKWNERYSQLNRKKQPSKLLLISFDGTRYNYPDLAKDFPAFRYLKENGVKAKYVKGAFPTLTLPSHFTLATGLHPESHGVVHNAYYNISTGEVLSLNYLETLRANEWWDNGAEPIWITAIKQGKRSGGFLFPGSDLKSNGNTATLWKSKETEEDNESNVQQNIIEMLSWFTKENLDFIAFYIDQPDFASHANGSDETTVLNNSLPFLNRTIVYLMQKVKEAGLLDDLNIIITSDHGHQNIDLSVGAEEAISLNKYVDRSHIKFAFNYGPLGFVQPKPGYVNHVYSKLKGAHSNINVYLKEEIPEKWHLKRNSRIPSIIIVANPGYQIYDEFPGFHAMKSDHGYDNDVPNMWAFYYSIGPSFKKNYLKEEFHSIHIYPLMCHLLGLQPAPNNGSLSVLMDTLV